MDGYAQTCGLSPINITMDGDNRPQKCDIPIWLGPDPCTEALLDLQVCR